MAEDYAPKDRVSRYVCTWVALVQPRTQLEWREQVYLGEYRCSVAVFV